MVVLGIETATSVLSVGLVSEGKILKELFMDENYAHAERLPEFIQKVLSETQIKGETLNLIAVSNGPGSFTGLRIGLAVAKGLAFGWQCPIMAVPTLDGMALQIPLEHKYGVVLLTARKGEVYQAVYQNNENLWERLGEVECIKDNDWGSNLVFDEMAIVGEGAVRIKDNIEPQFSKAVIYDKETVRPNGGMIAKLGEKMYLQGDRTSLSSVVPFYHKRFQGIA